MNYVLYRIGLVAVLLACTACTLPRSGPTHWRMLEPAQQEARGIIYFEGHDYIEQGFNLPPSDLIPSSWHGLPYNAEDIVPGDRLMVQVIENVTEGVFASGGNRIFVQQDIEVPSSGAIFFPYVGLIEVKGKTSEEVRREIEQQLKSQTPEPQVSVMRVRGDGLSVTVLGAVGKQGKIPLQNGTLTLLSIISAAGGPTIAPDATVVKLQRGDQTFDIPLLSVISHKKNDISMKPGDVVLLAGTDRKVQVIGAGSQQTRIPLDSNTYSLVDLLANIGGLNGSTANPKGIFVIRKSEQGPSKNTSTSNLIIHFDISRPEGLIEVRDFLLRAEDTVYISEAPIRDITKVIDTIIGVSGQVSDVQGAIQ